jgi:hypothetical protein
MRGKTSIQDQYRIPDGCFVANGRSNYTFDDPDAISDGEIFDLGIGPDTPRNEIQQIVKAWMNGQKVNHLVPEDYGKQ